MSEQKPIVPICHIPWQQMVIDSNGVVVPCAYQGAYGNVNPAAGNINEHSLEEIWNNEFYQNLRRNMAAGDLEAAGCAKCYALKQGNNFVLDYDHSADAEQPPHSPYAKNIQTLKAEIARGATVLKAKPTIISHSPSYRCNLRCIHCVQTSQRNQTLKRKEVTDEVLALAPLLVRLIAGGGEPFVQPEWHEFLNNFELDQYPYLEFAVTTNATRLTDKVEAQLRKVNRVMLNVSFDGVGEVYNTVRVGAEFEKTVANIRRMKSIADASPSPLSSAGLSMSVMKTNFKDIPNVVRFATEEEIPLGLAPVVIMPVDELLNSFNDPHRETEGWREALREGLRLIEEIFIPMSMRVRGLDESRRAVLLESWRKNFELLEGLIPWDILEKKHYRVKINLPAETVEEATKNKCDARYPLVAYIYEEGHVDPGTPPPYYAFLDGNHIEVSLPEGKYVIGVSTKWQQNVTLDSSRVVKITGTALGHARVTVVTKKQNAWWHKLQWFVGLGRLWLNIRIERLKRLIKKG